MASTLLDQGPAAPAGGAKTGARKESLAEVLRRRSGAGERETASAGVHLSLGAVTRNAEGTLVDVPLEQLQANPFQPRFQFQRQPLEELAQSLASEGQLEPAIARRVRHGGREVLEIVAGARRLEAAKICNASIRPFPTLRVDVRELTDDEAERIALIENLQRENLTPLEEGYRYWQLQERDPRKWSVRAIAEFVHKKKSTVQNRLGLVKDPAVAEAVLREQIPPTAGFHVLRLPAPEREAYLRAAVERQLTVEQIRTDVDRRLGHRRAVVVIPLDGQESQANSDGHDGQDGHDRVPAPLGHGGEDDGRERTTLVRSHVRRLGPALTPEQHAERRDALVAQRASLLARIDTLETELRERMAELRALERQLAALPDISTSAAADWRTMGEHA